MFSEAVCGIYLYLVILSYAPASRESDVHISLLKNKNKKKISQMKYKQLSIWTFLLKTAMPACFPQ